jgi:hypothetical protein
MLQTVETSTNVLYQHAVGKRDRDRNVGAKIGSFPVDSFNCHPPSSKCLSPVKTQVQNQNRMEQLNSLEELSIKDLLKGDFSFVEKYAPISQEKIFTKLLEDLHRATDRVKNCIYDPYSVSKSYHKCQWVSQVVEVASEYSSGVGSWGADNLVGPPQTFPRYGDISTAWAPLNSSGYQEFLHLKYQTPVHVCGVDVFETWNPGCVVKISAFDGTKWHVLWSGPVEQHRLPELPRVFSPAFPCTTFKSDEIRIDLDCRRSVSWTEIDAIRLRGRESYFWTPNTHCRYPPVFKQTVFQVLLCMNRLQDEEKISITQDVLLLIIQYLSQSYIDC